jgi:hypothetical protein
MSQLWFMPATPVLSNGGAERGLPISCFLNQVGDSLDDIVETWTENVWLASNGGSAACYLDVHHPEIEEFLEIRKPSGDFNRKSLNLHHGVNVTDDFMEAVRNDEEYGLISPKSGETVKTVNARKLWQKLLELRIQTGEPYLLFTDTVNNAMPAHQRKLGLKVTQSNLCSEITLPTGIGPDGHDRTAVCCLSSVNAEKFLEWKKHEGFLEDIFRFLDNVLQDFIDHAPDEMSRAVYSAQRERSVGLGLMGFHSFLQTMSVPMESPMAKRMLVSWRASQTRWLLRQPRRSRSFAAAPAQALSQFRPMFIRTRPCLALSRSRTRNWRLFWTRRARIHLRRGTLFSSMKVPFSILNASMSTKKWCSAPRLNLINAGLSNMRPTGRHISASLSRSIFSFRAISTSGIYICCTLP